MVAFGQNQSLKIDCQVDGDYSANYHLSRSAKGYNQYAIVSDNENSVKIDSTSIKSYPGGHEAFIIIDAGTIEAQATKLARLYKHRGNGEETDRETFLGDALSDPERYAGLIFDLGDDLKGSLTFRRLEFKKNSMDPLFYGSKTVTVTCHKH